METVTYLNQEDTCINMTLLISLSIEYGGYRLQCYLVHEFYSFLQIPHQSKP